MAYRRRYLSGQSATTVVIAEGAITSDKIVDGAVTHPKISPGAVDSERIIDETIKSEDIKAGEVKTSDIASGAVTTDKIASQAVTVDKLEASIQGIARPLTPGVDTAEIQDAKVTLAKLAPDSVDASKIKSGAVGPSELAVDACEESRIKDGACTRNKIAGSAIDSTKIAVNAVTGSEILNRSVGNLEIAIEGCHRENIKDLAINTVKLNPLAVTDAKLAESAVTEPKLHVAALAKRHLSSKRARMVDLHKEFVGGGLPAEWTSVVTAGGVVFPDSIEGLLLRTGIVIGNKIVISGEQVCNILEPRPFFDAIVLNRQVDLRDTFFGVEDGVGDRVGFECAGGGGAQNWFARCDYADGAVLVDTGIVSTVDVQDIFSFEIVDETTVKFYINGDLVATIVSTVPAATPVFPMIDFEAQGVGGKEMSIRSYSLVGDRV